MKQFFCYLLLLAAGCGWLGVTPTVAKAQATGYQVQAVLMEQQGDTAKVRITGNRAPTFTAYQLFSPPRLVIDIADARLTDHFTPARELPPGPLRELRGRQLEDRESAPAMVRLELLLATENPDYEVEQQEHDIVVSLRGGVQQPAGLMTTGGKQRPAGERTKQSVRQPATGQGTAAILADLKKQQPPAGITELIQPKIPPLSYHLAPAVKETAPEEEAPATAAPAPKAETSVAAPEIPELFDTFGLGGYEGERISIDYFKADLHNVFRLLGEISNRNIVVDEAVQGTLTLSLNQVPWDFAMDIIINLKDLQKEERFNTIVISPADKQFEWKAEAVASSLSVRPGGGVARQDALAVQQRLEVPREQVQAQELMRQAAEHSRRGEHVRALGAYEQALRLWPDNVRLAERLAVISLVHLGNNARAANFARHALRHDPENHRAALLAAVALASMERVEEAKGYFDQAIDRPQPPAEALVSYAAFAEEHDSPHGALALLVRHHRLYGDTLETMLARARLLDKVGAEAEAHREYRALLFSGYELPQDLQRYIEERIASQEGE